MTIVTTKWMIYGANGYTGELIAREAARRGHKPTLAGRSRDKVETLARKLGLEARVFGLDDPTKLAGQIEGHALVLHCAGPFSAALKAALPDATHLSLGFDSASGLSPGTAKTTVEGMAQGGKVRRDGKIVTVPLAYEVRRIDFGNGSKLAMTIPWGDVSTAYHSTGIPNIEVFIPGTRGMIVASKFANLLRPLLALPRVQAFLKARLGQSVQGPDEAKRARMPTYVWGEVRNARGDKKVARVRTVNGYSLTITGSLAVADHLMSHTPVGGAYTPSRLVGADLVTRLPGSGSVELT
jgi:short subunit dehydrogenase-like uncharacterized protein